jgi:prepilin-type N-terminal cleavage/methylation domain-containing protein
MIRSHAQQGLTLVELLLGLAITAILMVPLAAMFQTAASSSLGTRAALDLSADARFALERIARSAADAPAVTVGAQGTDPATWLNKLRYTLVGNNLVEYDTRVQPARNSIIAANVSAFQLSASDVGDGQAMMKIELTLTAPNDAGNTLSASRLVRVGSPP